MRAIPRTPTGVEEARMSTEEPGGATIDTVAARLQSALGDGYRVERELGGGGMSRVFLAHDIELSRDVVVKVLPEDVAEGISRERFRREVLLSANLQHPNIVGVIAAGDAQGLPYFVMPFVEGESLRTRLTDQGAMSIPHVVSVLRDVARALAFAHERGIVHRDIKPDNVLLAGGAAIVADFGVAKALASARQRKDHPHGTITSAGISLGTPAYMSPEQVAGDPATDHRADLYSLGVMTYEMLTGRTPFGGRAVTELMQAHLVEVPSPPSASRPGIPAALEGLVMRCLEKDPANRPADAGEILRVLDDPAVVSGAVTSSAMRSLVPNGSPARRRLPFWIGGAVIAAGAVVALVMTRPKTNDAKPQALAAAAPVAARGVAVLPMVSVSPDSSDAYLAVGMTDEITTALGRVRGLRVASRSAASAAQGAGGSVTDVARRLGVAFLLEGTVQRSGTRLRVAVRLVNASDGFSAWSEVYERTTSDLLAVQADIARQIALAIGEDVNAAASSATPSSLGSSGVNNETRDPDAYNDYLRGHYLLTRRGADSVQGAIDAFESAVSRDPAFARAYAELAQAYSVAPVATTGGGSEIVQKALFAAERALALDSTLSAAHAALGRIYNREWRWKDARSEFERALALDSTDAAAARGFAENLLANGEGRRAVSLLTGVLQRDPQSGVARSELALAQSIAGQRDLAVETARQAWAADSTSSPLRLFYSQVLLNAGRNSEAISELERIPTADRENPIVRGTLGYAYAKAGRDAQARALAATLEKNSQQLGAYPALAKIYLGLGDTNKALDALTWATAARDDFFAAESLASPLFDSVRTDPRFARVIGIVGLDSAALTKAR